MSALLTTDDTHTYAYVHSFRSWNLETAKLSRLPVADEGELLEWNDHVLSLTLSDPAESALLVP